MEEDIDVDISQKEFEFLLDWFKSTRPRIEIDPSATEEQKRICKALDFKLMVPVKIEYQH